MRFYIPLHIVSSHFILGNAYYRLVGQWWQYDSLLHCVHDQLPKLLQHSLQDGLLTDLSKQREADMEIKTV